MPTTLDHPDTDFSIFPAIDLRDGKVVRLTQGDPTRQTTYGDDPLWWAERWKAEGARWLHVINLSGAFAEEQSSNYTALEKILRVGLKVEFGGGIREPDHIRRAIELGVERVFLGTAAIQNPALVDWAVASYGPGHIAGDIGAAADGKVTIKGWQETTTLSVTELGHRFRSQGIEWCVLTDVSRDGTNLGANISSAAELQASSGMRVVASGGINSLSEVKQVRQARLAGVIIGRALYDGTISLRECLSAEGLE